MGPEQTQILQEARCFLLSRSTTLQHKPDRAFCHSLLPLTDMVMRRKQPGRSRLAFALIHERVEKNQTVQM